MKSQTKDSGKLRIGDDWNAIRIIALSQSNPLKAIAEFVENSIDAHPKNITITRGKEHGAHYLSIKDDGDGVPRNKAGLPDFKYVATHICDSIKRRLKADGNGSTLAINRYDPYGIRGSVNQGRFEYTGQAYVPELGLYYYKARMYNATLGRFMQTDPVGYKDDLDLYTYVGNDPLDRIDPTGLAEIELSLDAELFIGGGIKLAGSVSFDTQTLEVGTKGTFGIGGGFSAGVGDVGSISRSSTEPARSAITTSTSLVGSANLGPLGISKEVPVAENGKSVIGQPESTSGSVTKDVSMPKVGLKPQLKVGASASVDYSGKETSAAVANTVNAVKHAAEQIVQRIICPPSGPMQMAGCGN